MIWRTCGLRWRRAGWERGLLVRWIGRCGDKRVLVHRAGCRRRPRMLVVAVAGCVCFVLALKDASRTRVTHFTLYGISVSTQINTCEKPEAKGLEQKHSANNLTWRSTNTPLNIAFNHFSVFKVHV